MNFYFTTNVAHTITKYDCIMNFNNCGVIDGIRMSALGTSEWALQEDYKDAVIMEDGTIFWCKDGKLHRDGGLPAIIYADGRQEWYHDGELHKVEDLPAIIYDDGTVAWYGTDDVVAN